MKYNIDDLKEYYNLELERGKIDEKHKDGSFKWIDAQRQREIMELQEKISEKYDIYFTVIVNLAIRYKKEEILEILKDWKIISKSPYSYSCYNSNDIDWNYKPENSLRLSDHWNFESNGETHCKLDYTDEYTEKLLLCEYINGYYHVVKEF